MCMYSVWEYKRYKGKLCASGSFFLTLKNSSDSWMNLCLLINQQQALNPWTNERISLKWVISLILNKYKAIGLKAPIAITVLKVDLKATRIV